MDDDRTIMFRTGIIPNRLYVVLEGGSLDGQLVATSWRALRAIVAGGLPLDSGPLGVRRTDDGSGYFSTDRVDSEGRPILEWREGG